MAARDRERESMSSIQYALQLENQLDHEHENEHEPIPEGNEYDPEVLTSIVIQLRSELATVTYERDQAIKAHHEAGPKTAALEARVADLEELRDGEAKRADALQVERDEARHRAAEAEEQVNLLRAKVEESRRGVMRLQAESRRLSTQTTSGPIPLDLRSPSLATSKASKRASFQLPQTPTASTLNPASAARPIGGSHRRISSLSDPGPHPGDIPLPDAVNIIDGLPPSPATHTFSESRNGDGSLIKTKRLSLLVKRDTSPPPSPELELLKLELVNARREAEQARREASEANDRREASDACIKALREFIAEQALGMQEEEAMDGRESPAKGLKGLRLPPLPSEDTAQEEPQPAKKGWGIRLWSNSAAATPQEPASVPTAPSTSTEPLSPSATPTPLTSFVSSWTRSVSSTSQTPSVEGALPPLPAPATTTPTPPKAISPPVAGGLSRKFSLFKRGSAATTNSISSASASVHTPELVTSSESTSPQTDTRSLTSGVLSLEEEHEGHAMDAKRAGDVTPTGALEDESRPENLEVVAL